MNIYFTSDLHMSHQAEFLWGPRNFSSYKEMNEAIVERWNKTVKPEDIVYNLGDMVMNDIDEAIPCLQQLNGTQYWYIGNHDTINKIAKINKACRNIRIEPEHYSTILKFGKLSFYISHYPTLTANFDDKHFSQHLINLHGHTHQQKNWLDPNNPFMYHVGLDSHNCTPVHLDEIITDIRQRWNEVGQLPFARKELYNYPNI